MARPPKTPPRDLDEQAHAAFAPILGSVGQILRSGLPITPKTAPVALLTLDGVTARSVDPSNALARVDALDRLVRRELRRLDLHHLREAAAILFGLGRAGLSQTERRRQAATTSGYSFDHVRQHLEPRIADQLAWQLYRDSLQYVQRREDGVAFAASGDTPTISEDDITDVKDADREALISRIWSDVYGLRADLITRESRRGDPDRTAEFEEAVGGALWHLARLLTNLDRYIERYGKDIMAGNSAWNAEGLIRLAGWSGEVTQEQARELRFELARCGEWERAQFLTALQATRPVADT